MTCQIAIMAGGRGTRLAARSGGAPKPMVPVFGKPLLEYQIELCKEHGFSDILLLVHHKHEVISEHFRDGSQFGVNIHYRIEEEPRGTAGALCDALHLMADEFLVLYGDTFIDVDLKRFFDFHCDSNTDATLFLHPNDHPHDSDLVDVDQQGFVRKVHPYPHPEGKDFRNLVNAALYVFRRDALNSSVSASGQSDIAKQLVPALIDKGLKVKSYISPEYIKDMGTPERLDKVERDFDQGLTERLSWRHPRSAVFLDRDGTINREVNHLSTPDEIELLPGAGQAIYQLNRAGILAVVTTNQPVVARGDVTLEGLDSIHARLETQLGAEKAYLDAIYYCPHHPDKGFEGEVPELKFQCTCRKPETGMIDAAVKDLGISRRQSWMIGDTTTDIAVAQNTGVRSILLRSGFAGGDGKYQAKPDYIATNLTEAVHWITTGNFDVRQKLIPSALQILNGGRLALIGGLSCSGKTSAAYVLKDLLAFFGKQAHVLSLDGWLKPVSKRLEGNGVLARYDLDKASAQISELAGSKTRQKFELPVYEPAVRKINAEPDNLSVGPDDVLIVEGVIALHLQNQSVGHDPLKIYVETPEETRRQRLHNEYSWRGHTTDEINRLIESRAKDEEPVVRQSAKYANFTINV